MEKHIESMPMVALRGMTILPEMIIHFDVSRAKSVEAVQKVMQTGEQKIFLVAQRELHIEEPTQKDVFEMGTVAVVKQVIKLSKNVLRVLISGEQRAKLLRLEMSEPYMLAQIEVSEEPDENEEEKLQENVRAKNLRDLFLNIH